MTDTTQPRTHLTDAEVAKLRAERDEARAALAPLDGTDWTPASLLRAYREMSQAHEDSQAEVGRLRADLARALELIAELRDVGERADRAFARYDTGGGETPPDLGSATRAQGAAVEGPESAVDGQTPATPTQPIGAPSIAPQHAERTSQ